MSFFEVTEQIKSTQPIGARAFDFLQGEWIIAHRRLKNRLVGSDEWHEFETPYVMQTILGGLGNVDQCRVEGDAFFEGASLRLFDKADDLWRIYWMDSDGATLFPPTEGKFDGLHGVFYGDDVQDGVPVKVQFHWDCTDLTKPVWYQMFSADDGKTWETNWWMYFRRT